MKNYQPLVSVIVRTKDRPFLLQEALKSLIQQNYRPLEIIIVNDGSREIDIPLPKNEPSLRITYTRNKRKPGRSGAANTGLLCATGEWIGFLDDDDLLLPEAIASLILFARASQVVYGQVEIQLLLVDNSWKTINIHGSPFSKEALFFCNYIPTCGLFFKRELIEQIGLFDEEFLYLEDWDFIYRLAQKASFIFVPKIVAIYRLFGRGFILEIADDPLKEYPWRSKFYQKHWHSIKPQELAKGYYDFLKIQGLQINEERNTRLMLEKEIINLREELNKILNSRSWKITEPLRKAKRFLKKIRF